MFSKFLSRNYNFLIFNLQKLTQKLILSTSCLLKIFLYLYNHNNIQTKNDKAI